MSGTAAERLHAPVAGPVAVTAPRGVAVLLAVLVLGTAAIAVPITLGGGDSAPAPVLVGFEVLLYLAAAIVAVRALPRYDGGWPWALIATGLACWAVGDSVYGLMVRGDTEPQLPSPADPLYLAFYPLVAAGLVGLLLARAGRVRWSDWVDALVVALGVASLTWLWFSPVVQQATAPSLLALVVGAGYPLADFVLLSLVVGILAVLAWPRDPMWLLLGAGVAMFALGDSAYFEDLARNALTDGSTWDLVWLASFTVIAFAAWSPTGSGLRERSVIRGLVAPVAAAFAALGLLVAGNVVEVPVTSTVLAAITLVVAGVRGAAVLRGVSVRDAVRRQGQTDTLTGLGNRRGFNAAVDDALAERADHDLVALLLMDIVGFRAVNEAYGHVGGDDVLREMARRLRSACPSEATLVRLGADEFSVLLAPCPSLHAARVVADRVDRAMAAPFEVDGGFVHLEVVVGISVCPDHAITRGDLLNAADGARRRAAVGHSGAAVFDPALDGGDRDRLRIVEELRTALDDGQIVCVYQPKLDLRDGRVHAVETLVRWQHPQRGMVFPDTFLPLAEGAGLMRRLTEVILDVAIAQAAAWHGSGMGITTAVNLSMTNLLDLGLPDTVSAILHHHRLPPDLLVLEVTETGYMADPERAQQVVRRLHDMGIALSVDDYGKAYSSLGQLGDLEAEEIKLDAAFVTGVTDRPDLQSIVRSTVALARDLGLRMVVEGVETDADLATVRALGCDIAQGYGIRRPGSAEEITQWLRDRAAART